MRRPSTIGKIEAFHKAYTVEAWIYPTHREFVNYWNYERSHQGIGYLYPADAYFRDLRDTSQWIEHHGIPCITVNNDQEALVV